MEITINWINEQIEKSKDFIKRNHGHCASCIGYCHEEQGKIDLLRELKASHKEKN